MKQNYLTNSIITTFMCKCNAKVVLIGNEIVYDNIKLATKILNQLAFLNIQKIVMHCNVLEKRQENRVQKWRKKVVFEMRKAMIWHLIIICFWSYLWVDCTAYNL